MEVEAALTDKLLIASRTITDFTVCGAFGFLFRHDAPSYNTILYVGYPISAETANAAILMRTQHMRANVSLQKWFAKISEVPSSCACNVNSATVRRTTVHLPNALLSVRTPTLHQTMCHYHFINMSRTCGWSFLLKSLPAQYHDLVCRA